jgi:hypothetical protein
LITIFLSILVLLKILPPGGVTHQKVEHIEKSAGENGLYTFSRSKDEMHAAIRAGIFMEDLSVIVNTTGKKGMKEKITNMLSGELKILVSEKSSLFKELVNIDTNNIKNVLNRIRELMDSRSYSELFSFGCFVEHSIFDTFENKKPGQKDIEKYQQIATKYNLPQGIVIELEKLQKARDVKKSRKICIAIKEMLF